MTSARILIVQDRDSDAAALAACLRELGHTVCATVPSGEQAVGEASAARPDLALIDLGLGSGAGGVEAAERIGSEVDIPVVCLAGDDDTQWERAEAARPFGYVLKPFEKRQLHFSIQTALSLHARERAHRETQSRMGRTIDGLRSDARLMEAAFDGIDDGVIAAKENGETLVFNAGAKRLFGSVRPDAAEDRPSGPGDLFLLDRVTPFPEDDLPLTRAVAGRSSDDVEMFVRNTDTQAGRLVRVSGRPIGNGESLDRGGVMVCRDVTRDQETAARLEQAVTELRIRNQVLESVLDHIDDGILISDVTGRNIFLNAAAKRILGAEAVNPPLSERSQVHGIFYPDRKTYVPPQELPLLRALNGQDTGETTLFIRNEANPDGVVTTVRGRALRSADGDRVMAGMAILQPAGHGDTDTGLDEIVSKLRDKTALLESICDNISDGIIVADTEGRISFANATTVQVFGDWLVDPRMEDWSATYGMFYPDVKTPVPTEQLPLARALQGEETDETELFVRNEKNPHGSYVRGRAFPIYNSDRTAIIAAMAVFRDVTRDRETESRLRQTSSELHRQTQLLETVFETMNEGIIVTDSDGQVVLTNRRAKKMFGAIEPLYASPEGRARRHGVFHPDQETLVSFDELPLPRALRGERTDEVEMFVRNRNIPDGVHASVSGRPLQLDIGGAKGAVIIYRDITEAKQAEAGLRQTLEELRDQGELMEATFKSISEGIVVADATGKFLYVNPYAKQILGLRDAETRLPDTYHPDRETPVKTEDRPLHRAIFRGESVDDEDLFIRNGNGAEGVHIRVSARPLLAHVGGVRGGVIIFRDVTDEVNAREALSRAFAQGRLEIVETILHNIGNAINSVTVGIETVHQTLAADPLMRRLRALAKTLKGREADWIDYIANDPQGQKVLPFVVAIADDFAAQNEALTRTVGRVRDRANHIADIVRTQKALGGPRMDRKDINLKDALRDAVRLLQDSLSQRGIQVEIDCGDAPAEIRIHESPFHQMIVNLVKNSLEAIDDLSASGRLEETPRIRIRAYVEDDYLLLDVSDNGIGIDKTHQKLIFTAGYTTKESGTGLGLHSSANFVTSSGGQIYPLSEGTARGTTMRIRLKRSAVTPSPAPAERRGT